MVIAIGRRGEKMIFNPSADTVIKESDALVVIGNHDSLIGLEKMANPSNPRGAARRHRH